MNSDGGDDQSLLQLPVGGQTQTAGRGPGLDGGSGRLMGRSVRPESGAAPGVQGEGMRGCGDAQAAGNAENYPYLQQSSDSCVYPLRIFLYMIHIRMLSENRKSTISLSLSLLPLYSSPPLS